MEAGDDEKTALISVRGWEVGEPIARPSIWRGKQVVLVACILFTELCERLTFYSVTANLLLYGTTVLDLESTTATSVSLYFTGTVFIIPVIGGYIADTLAGKYNTILGSGLIYVLGLFLLPTSAFDYTDFFGTDDDGVPFDLSISMRRVYYFMGLVFVAIGTGGIKANVGPFGAQQVEDLGPEAVQSFFNWFYWFINAGSFIAFLGVAYIQQNVSFSLGYLIPFISMIVALVIFVAVKSKYKQTPPGGSIIVDSLGVCCDAGCRKFDNARKSNGGKYPDDFVTGVIAVLRVIPVFLLIILYWAIYSQMQSTFFLQGERMDAKLGSVIMPIAVLNVFNTIIILILIPIMDKVVYPFLAKYNRSPTHLQRIGLGFVLSALSVLVAGILEIYRKKDIEENGVIEQKLSGDTFNASSISIFAQVPQFALVGASEVFASVSGLEFAYSQAPSFMQGLVMGLFLMTSGIGNYVSEAILEIVKEATGADPPDAWFPEEINDGKTENLFFMLAALMAVNTLVFVVVAYFYKYKSPEETQYLEVEKVVDPDKPPPYEQTAGGFHENPGYSEHPESTRL
ncbi:solute carrier family 15 member 4-like isoform X2 [Crassostrea angulata]|uniref:solute carrier family 15 member 4-like isoform X2 n=1 Tax=Magallana angulata TaxID=2784310 RepID=UPI0022B1CC0E|nr:solute carrier family 15 member 4-like isoform X2 [Crassostrea angulata]